MRRRHAIVISALLAAAIVAGALAAIRTAGAGSSATDAVVAEKQAALDRYEASLQQALSQAAPASPAQPSPAAQLVFVTAQPSASTAGDDEDEHEGEHEGEAEDEGEDD